MPKYNLRTPNARRSIPSGSKQHIAPLPTPGLAVTYRKSESLGGVWFARKHREGTTKYEFHRIGAADDEPNAADGATFFSYQQAADAAERWYRQPIHPSNKSCTVESLMNDYLDDQKTTKRLPQDSIDKIRKRFDLRILPELGNTPVNKLTHQQLKKWFHDLAKSAPLVRTIGSKRVFRTVADPEDEEYLRKRQASANRDWNLLRAMLNYGYKNDRVTSQSAWDKIQSFRYTNEPNIVEISEDDLIRLIDALNPVLQPLAKAAVYTGARYSELCRMKVKHFSPYTNKVFIPKSKNNNSRHVLLNDEALDLFIDLTKNRSGEETIFVRDGLPWRKTQTQRYMQVAARAVRVPEKFTFHQFRHKCACMCLENGMRMEEVAYMLGHRSVKITEKYYAQFSHDHMQDKVQRFAPRLRPAAPQNDPNDATRVIPFPKAANA
jgi:integrase